MESIKRLPQFLLDVENSLANMTEDKMKSFLLELARITPEEKRSFFEIRLKEFNEGKMKTEDLINKEINKSILALRKIMDDEICIYSRCNPEYDDWYHPFVEEFVFEDEGLVFSKINCAIKLIHKAMDEERYVEVYELVKVLLDFRINVEGEYCVYIGDEDGYFTLVDLLDKECIEANKDFFEECLYIIYVNNNLKSRPKEIYKALVKLKCYDFKFEKLLQLGSKMLDDYEEFLIAWIKYLINTKNDKFEKSLYNSISLIKDKNKYLDFVYEAGLLYPVLVKDILNDNLDKQNDKEMLELGLYMIRNLDSSNSEEIASIKEEIAVIIAYYARMVNDKRSADYCYFEAFKANPQVVSFLRMKNESSNYPSYKENIEKIIANLKEEALKADRYSNIIDDYRRIAFFNGEYDIIFNNSFKKTENIYLIVLLLNDGDFDTPAMQDVFEALFQKFRFNKQEYYQMEVNNELDEYSLFKQIIGNIKNEYKNILVDYDNLIKYAKEMIEEEIESIMKANRRNDYSMCACLVVALGEALESIGIVNAKDAYVKEYMTKYKLRTAFHRELKALI